MKAQRLGETREAAAALIEDLRHIRDLASKSQPERGEVRRLSGILRRLLVDNDLSKVSGPRLGKFDLLAPDNKPVYRTDSKNPLHFFESGGASVFGVFMRAAMVEAGSTPRLLEGFDPDATVSLRLDSFLSQRVLCLDGVWATRLGVVKFAANVASGVHSGPAETEDEKLLQRIRGRVAFRFVDKSFSILFNPAPPSADFNYDPRSLDPLLVELLAAATFVTASPDVKTLEEIIAIELRQSAGHSRNEPQA